MFWKRLERLEKSQWLRYELYPLKICGIISVILLVT
jgi:hypothetical protein